jgi:drug/metabolite transporter (DMT)-like permease
MDYWITSILLGTILFVFGQVYLRKSFNKDSDYISTWLFFCLTLGVSSLLILTFLNIIPENEIINTKIIMTTPKIISAIIAGLFFFFGNAFWIYSISTKNPIGNIRTIMAGFETALLFIAGYLYFSEAMNLMQVGGVLLVVLGIYLIGCS